MSATMNNKGMVDALKSEICKELFKKINEEEKEEDGCQLAEQHEREYNEQEKQDADYEDKVAKVW